MIAVFYMDKSRSLKLSNSTGPFRLPTVADFANFEFRREGPACVFSAQVQ